MGDTNQHSGSTPARSQDPIYCLPPSWDRAVQPSSLGFGFFCLLSLAVIPRACRVSHSHPRCPHVIHHSCRIFWGCGRLLGLDLGETTGCFREAGGPPIPGTLPIRVSVLTSSPPLLPLVPAPTAPAGTRWALAPGLGDYLPGGARVDWRKNHESAGQWDAGKGWRGRDRGR